MAFVFSLSLGAFLAAPLLEVGADCSCYDEVTKSDSGNFTGLQVVSVNDNGPGGCLNNTDTPPVCSIVGHFNCNAGRRITFTAPSGVPCSRTTGHPKYSRHDPDGSTHLIGIGAMPCNCDGPPYWDVDLVVVCGQTQTNEIFFYNTMDNCQADTDGTNGWVAWVKVTLECGGCGVARPAE